jgi:hypothetical protein
MKEPFTSRSGGSDSTPRLASRTFKCRAIRMTMGLMLLGTLGCSSILNGLINPYPSSEDQQKFLADLDRQGLTQQERCRRMHDFHAEWAKDQAECREYLDSLEYLRDAAEEGRVKIQKGNVEVHKP